MLNFFDFLGRVFLSSVFLFSGYNKFFNFDNTVSWMESYGVPGFLLWPTIVLEIILPIFLIIGYKTKLSASLLCIFTIATAVIFHTDFSEQMQIIAFFKNLGLAAGFLFLVVNGSRDWSIDTKKKYVRL